MKHFETIEEEGIVVYDESDDYDPGEDEKYASEDSSFRLMDNEEIFTDEYMREYDRKMEAKKAKEKRVQRLISLSVISGIIIYIAILSLIFF